MRLYFFTLLGLSLVAFCPPEAVVRWLGPTECSLGQLQPEVPVTHHFEFQNISGDTLRIDNVRTSCGCTLPDWSPAPIPPDAISQVTVEYDAEDKGRFRKKVKVYFDKQRRAEVLWIEGEVVK